MPASWRWSQACTRRLGAGSLAGSLAASPAEVARAICGVQAQVASAAAWSIGLRLDGATRADISAAVATERGLVKTFGPRFLAAYGAGHACQLRPVARRAPPLGQRAVRHAGRPARAGRVRRSGGLAAGRRHAAA